MQSSQLYPSITTREIGRHSSAVLYHDADVVLTQRDPPLCTQQIDLERARVITGYGRASFIVDVAEIHRRIGVSMDERLVEELRGFLTIMSSAFGVEVSHRKLPQIETVSGVTAHRPLDVVGRSFRISAYIDSLVVYSR